MRVLQLMKTSEVGIWALTQMRELVRMGVEVHAAMPPGGALIPAYQEAGVILHPVSVDFPTRRPWELGQALARMRAVAKEVQPDIIHSHYVGTTLTMRLALGSTHPVPRVYQVAGPLHLEHPLFRETEVATAGQADFWIGACHLTCNLYRKARVPEERIFLCYHCRDVGQWVRGPRGKLRQELGLPEDAKVVGMVAYIYAPKRHLGQRRGLKGHEDLIDAMALCLKSRPDLYCVVAGGAWGNAAAYERQVQAYAKKRCGDRVIFLGTRRDVKEIYPDFDLVAHPSHSENLGGAVESLLLGVPTVATNVGGFPDIIVPGETGWLVPPKQPARLAEAILDVLSDPARAAEVAVRGEQRARRQCDTVGNAHIVLDIYGKVTGKLVN